MRRALAIALGAASLTACATDDDTKTYRVPSSSMEPTLHCARPGVGCEANEMDFVAAHPYGSHKPARGDLVVFRTPPLARIKCGSGGTYIKRLIGLPGERWAERRGFVYIDGGKLNEPYIRPDRRDDQSFAGGRIPRDRYLLLGDNRASSCDSRIWGLVPRSNLIGWVFLIKRGSKRIHSR
jgi:signal peptidase I